MQDCEMYKGIESDQATVWRDGLCIRLEAGSSIHFGVTGTMECKTVKCTRELKVTKRLCGARDSVSDYSGMDLASISVLQGLWNARL